MFVVSWQVVFGLLVFAAFVVVVVEKVNECELYGFAEPSVVKSSAHGGCPLTENWRNFKKLIVSRIIEALSRKSV